MARPFQAALSFTLAHRKTVLGIFALLLCLAALRFYGHGLDTSIVSLFPDSSPQLARTGSLLEFSPGARVMFVELTADNSVSPGAAEDKLGRAAAQIRKDLGDLLHSVDEGVDGGAGAASPPASPGGLLKLLPFLFDAGAEARLAPRLEPEALRQRLALLRQNMSGPLAFLPKEYLQADPLGFLEILSDKFPHGEVESPFIRALRGSELPLSADGRSALLILQPQVGLNDTAGATAFMDRLEASLALAAPPGSGLTALSAGGLEFTAHNTRAIEHDLKFTITLSLALLALIYLFTVRSAGAVWLFLTPVAAVIFAGSALSVVWPVTAGLALGFGAAVLGLAEDYAVLAHFAMRGNPGRKAEALAGLVRPMSFSALLCIGSFCVLTLSAIPALRQLGFFAAFSLACGLGIALFVLPACPWIDRPPLPGHAVPKAPALKPRRLPTLLLLLGCLAVCTVGVRHIPFDASFQSQGADSHDLQSKLHDLRSRWAIGAETLTWASSGASLDEALERAAGLAAKLRALDGADGAGETGEAPASFPVFSLADLLPPPAERQANLARWRNFTGAHPNFPDELAAAARGAGFKADTFAGFAGWFAAGYAPYVDAGTDFEVLADLRRAGLGQLLWWMLLEKDGEFHVLTVGGAGAVETSAKTVLLSSAALSEGLNQAFRHEIYLLPLAGAVCFLLLVVCFRRPTLVMLACLPPLFGLSSITLWLLASGRPMTLPAAAALILVIGLGANYGIVMLHELRSQVRLGAFRSILVSGLTTLAGIGVLILARHPVLQTLGGVTFFGLMVEMAAVLLIVPLLCKHKQGHV